jgi:hypothetical protein
LSSNERNFTSHLSALEPLITQYLFTT